MGDSFFVLPPGPVPAVVWEALWQEWGWVGERVLYDRECYEHCADEAKGEDPAALTTFLAGRKRLRRQQRKLFDAQLRDVVRQHGTTDGGILVLHPLGDSGSSDGLPGRVASLLSILGLGDGLFMRARIAPGDAAAARYVVVLDPFGDGSAEHWGRQLEAFQQKAWGGHVVWVGPTGRVLPPRVKTLLFEVDPTLGEDCLWHCLDVLDSVRTLAQALPPPVLHAGSYVGHLHAVDCRSLAVLADQHRGDASAPQVGLDADVECAQLACSTGTPDEAFRGTGPDSAWGIVPVEADEHLCHLPKDASQLELLASAGALPSPNWKHPRLWVTQSVRPKSPGRARWGRPSALLGLALQTETAHDLRIGLEVQAVQNSLQHSQRLSRDRAIPHVFCHVAEERYDLEDALDGSLEILQGKLGNGWNDEASPRCVDLFLGGHAGLSRGRVGLEDASGGDALDPMAVVAGIHSRGFTVRLAVLGFCHSACDAVRSCGLAGELIRSGQAQWVVGFDGACPDDLVSHFTAGLFEKLYVGGVLTAFQQGWRGFELARRRGLHVGDHPHAFVDSTARIVLAHRAGHFTSGMTP